MMQALYDGNFFETTRVFPTQDIGKDAGWHYSYPVMEVCATSTLSAVYPAVALVEQADMQMAACKRGACMPQGTLFDPFFSTMLSMHQ